MNTNSKGLAWGTVYSLKPSEVYYLGGRYRSDHALSSFPLFLYPFISPSFFFFSIFPPLFSYFFFLFFLCFYSYFFFSSPYAKIVRKMKIKELCEFLLFKPGMWTVKSWGGGKEGVSSCYAHHSVRAADPRHSRIHRQDLKPLSRKGREGKWTYSLCWGLAWFRVLRRVLTGPSDPIRPLFSDFRPGFLNYQDLAVIPNIL